MIFALHICMFWCPALGPLCTDGRRARNRRFISAQNNNRHIFEANTQSSKCKNCCMTLVCDIMWQFTEWKWGITEKKHCIEAIISLASLKSFLSLGHWYLLLLIVLKTTKSCVFYTQTLIWFSWEASSSFVDHHFTVVGFAVSEL